MAFAEWADIAGPYDRSFGALCAQTIPAVLEELGAARFEARPADAPQRPLAGTPADAPQRAGSGVLLDAGTGTGALAVAAAQAGWRVQAFDAEPSMVDFARARTDAGGIRFDVARMPGVPYPDASVDAVAANFAINHVDHPRDCLADLRRVLRPGGRLAATVWPWEPTPTGRLWREIQEETGARPPEQSRLPAGSDFERTEDGLAGLLADCGFIEVRARRVRFTWRIDVDDLWSGVEAGIAVIGYAWRAADETTRERMRAAYDARTPALTGEDGLLQFEMSAVLASGARPVE
ncbi:class I SAM-dependent methyltransferase [Gryllotalpicola ginsengisoli]|uniref:class I SAM-dependent methyltransferase n=1 Tax=Gryllotalpicola ginsengisoli TaxID=444608 RepID=UPI0003B2EBE9|nr:class I SAM-dependent methyltransferase [Gryllotalpicola ginsengisoli]